MDNKEAIRHKNDVFRTSFTGGSVILTSGVQSSENLDKILNAVRCFDDFNEDNDPWKEHDFGAVMLDSEKYFWKIDYYENSDCEYGFAFEDDKPDTSYRTLTVMLTSEY
ncbi:MAG: DUF3768 domain-containing protein [bacterium]